MWQHFIACGRLRPESGMAGTRMAHPAVSPIVGSLQDVVSRYKLCNAPEKGLNWCQNHRHKLGDNASAFCANVWFRARCPGVCGNASLSICETGIAGIVAGDGVRTTLPASASCSNTSLVRIVQKLSQGKCVLGKSVQCNADGWLVVRKPCRGDPGCTSAHRVHVVYRM